MTVHDVYAYIDSFAPFASAADWDNSGLLVGDKEAPVNKAVVCLDVTKEAIAYAVENKASLIISHHPIIFSAQKNFLSDSMPYQAAQNGISVICAHTNLDKAVDGVNDSLCRALSLDFEKCPEAVCEGFLNVCTLKTEMSAAAFAEYVSKKLNCSVDFNGEENIVSKIGVCSGAGGEFVTEAALCGCDALLTGEAKYHEFLDADAVGMSVFAAGHYETEVSVVNVLANKLNLEFKDAVFLPFIGKNTVITVK